MSGRRKATPAIAEDLAREAVQRFFTRHEEALRDRKMVRKWKMGDMRTDLFAQWAAAAVVVRRVSPEDWDRVRMVRPGGALASSADAGDALALDEFGAELLWSERRLDALAGECAEGWHAALMVRLATGMYVRTSLHAFPEEEHEEGSWSAVDWAAVRRDMGEPPADKYPAGVKDGRGGVCELTDRNALICSAIAALVEVGFDVHRNPGRRGERENPSACSLVSDAVFVGETSVEEIYAKRSTLPGDCPRFDVRWECAEVEGERAATGGEPRDPERVRILALPAGDPGRPDGAAVDEAVAWLRGHDRVTGHGRAPLASDSD